MAEVGGFSMFLSKMMTCQHSDSYWYWPDSCMALLLTRTGTLATYLDSRLLDRHTIPVDGRTRLGGQIKRKTTRGHLVQMYTSSRVHARVMDGVEVRIARTGSGVV